MDRQSRKNTFSNWYLLSRRVFEVFNHCLNRKYFLGFFKNLRSIFDFYTAFWGNRCKILKIEPKFLKNHKKILLVKTMISLLKNTSIHHVSAPGRILPSLWCDFSLFLVCTNHVVQDISWQNGSQLCETCPLQENFFLENLWWIHV